MRMWPGRGAGQQAAAPVLRTIVGGDGSDIGALEVGQPWLNIQQSGSTAVLSWPNYYGNFSVQTNGNVSSPGGWDTLPGTAVVVGTSWFQTNHPISADTLFRLKSNDNLSYY